MKNFLFLLVIALCTLITNGQTPKGTTNAIQYKTKKAPLGTIQSYPAKAKIAQRSNYPGSVASPAGIIKQPLTETKNKMVKKTNKPSFIKPSLTNLNKIKYKPRFANTSLTNLNKYKLNK